ncbi:amidohydrolase family protein [Amycolatopsis aidingensis]|uniref:amidohydrolase family protein n=1 Tax=Amycolatopsis aidingensis TaxID=2842453 RepID=UPI001C0A941F|nr:amidohydrolase family protein [Amycolatopsis aidingensis]
MLVPGLIDCHAHIAFPQPGKTPRSARLFEAAAVLRTLLGRGVTTVRDAWGADAGFRLTLEQGWITGPDLLLSLRQLCTTGGIGDTWNPRTGAVDALGDPALPEPVFDGPDAARAAVRRMVRAGADWIKLGASGAMSQGDRVHDPLVTAAELHAVVDEAGRYGGRGGSPTSRRTRRRARIPLRSRSSPPPARNGRPAAVSCPPASPMCPEPSPRPPVVRWRW